MKKYIVPSLPLLMVLLLFLCFLLSAIFWLTHGILLVMDDYNDGFLWAICLFVSMAICYCILIFMILAMLFWIHFSCRLIRISNDGLVVGWFKKEVYRWEDISGFGLSMLYPAGNPSPAGLTDRGRMRIYLAKGTFHKQEFFRRGISGVWNYSILKRYPVMLKLLNRLRSRIKLEQIVDFEAPDDIIWLPYSDSVYRFLQSKINKEQ